MGTCFKVSAIAGEIHTGLRISVPKIAAAQTLVIALRSGFRFLNVSLLGVPTAAPFDGSNGMFHLGVNALLTSAYGEDY